MRRLLTILALVAFVLAFDAGCERTQYVTLPGKTDTLVVQLPGHVDTLIVPRVDTAYITRPETSYVQLPGRVDTVIKQLPGHVDTLYVPRVDTVVVVHVDTTIVQKTDTLLVVTHDTVIVHDTVTRVDTVRLSQVPVYLCIYMTMGDTLAAFNWRDTPYCDAAHLAAQTPGTWNTLLNVDTLVMQLPSVQAALTRMANTPPSPLILPGYWRAHRQ